MFLNENKRVVIKVGSSTLTHDGGKPNLQRLEQLSRVISELKNRGMQPVLVSSGAIAVGKGRMKISSPSDVATKQALAAIGQSDLIGIYDRFFSEYGYAAAQILINRDVILNDERRKNVINTFEKLIELDAVPIVNENDSVSTEEILFGDNDNLSAIVAELASAKTLIILTDIDGYYSEDPRKNKKAKKIDKVFDITEDMINNAGGSGSSVGTGGMKTKLEAARYAQTKGISTVIMSGQNPTDIYKLFEGKNIGTIFVGEDNGNN